MARPEPGRARSTRKRLKERHMNPIRLLIVDDHAIVRQGLRAIIRVTPDMELVGEADNGRTALDLATKLAPDVVLMDLVMPDLDGVTAIGLMKRDRQAVRIIALTTFVEADLVLGAVQAGADGYLLKDVDVQELTRVARGLTNRQIADTLAISEKTVSVHVSNMLSKLGLASRTQAALYAVRIGLIPPGELG